MSKFGWSYPPGVTHVPGDEESPCQICHAFAEICNCPECEVCGVAGDPACINVHMAWDKWPALRGLTPAVEEEQRRENEMAEAEYNDFVCAPEEQP